MDEISFKVSEEERKTILAVAKRAKQMQMNYEQDTLLMDLCATHANGTPLDFQKLLGFDDFNFMHDLYGIYDYLDRETGKLTLNFRPRCSRS